MLEKKARGRECLDALRQLYQVLLVYPRKYPSPHFRQLATTICTTFTEAKLPNRLRALCSSIVQQCFDDEPEVFKSLSNRQLLEFILPATLALGGDSALTRHLPFFVQCVTTQDPVFRTSAFPGLILSLRRRVRLQYSQAIKPVETHMAEWLTNARNALEQKDSSSTVSSFFKQLNITGANAVTELNGMPAQSFFTVLNAVGQFSEDQISNTCSFSILYQWINLLYGPQSSYHDEFEMSFPFKEATIKYCLRLIDQSNLKPGGDGSAPAKAIKGFGGDYPDLVLVEAIRILDLVCRLDTAQVPSLFPAVKKIFNRDSTKKNGQVFLALLQFFVNHGIVVGYDVEPVFRTFFESYLSTHYNNASLAFQTLSFFLTNKRQLLQHTSVFTQYFPPLVKLLAWFPYSYQSEFLELLPAFISPATFIELFHLILDLPLVAAALERIEYDTMFYAGEEEAPPSEFRVLYNYVLRNESGVSINFWESSTTLEKLHDFFKVTPLTARVVAAGEVVPRLLDVYFDVIIQHGLSSHLHELLPVLFERVDQLFPYKDFQKEARKAMVIKVMAIFHKYPSFVVTFKDAIIEIMRDGTHPNRKELILTLCWLVGEYASSSVSHLCTPRIVAEYHEVLETFAFERMSLAKMELTDPDAAFFMSSASAVPAALATSAEPLSAERLDEERAEEKAYSTRLMIIVISALAKLASRLQDLGSRVIICLAKVIKQKECFHASVHQRAHECIQILRFPSIASAILDTRMGMDGGFAHYDENSALPFVLLPSAEFVPDTQPIHEFEIA